MLTENRDFVSNGKILVVDDQIEIVHEIATRYESEGYIVFRAYSGNEAATVLLQKDPDLLLTDLRMLDGHGLELISRVRAMPNPQPLIFCMTAYNDIDMGEAYDYGVDLFLAKPFDLNLLLKATDHFIGDREKLLKARHNMPSILDDLFANILIARDNGEIVYRNKTAQTMGLRAGTVDEAISFIGSPTEKAINFVDIVSPNNTTECIKTWMGKIVTEHHAQIPVEIFAFRGNWRNEVANYLMIVDSSETLMRMENLENEKKIILNQIEGHRKSVSMVYHDLANVIQVVRGGVQCLQRAYLDESSHRWVTRISDASSQMVTLLKDLSDLSSLEAGRLSLTQETFNLKDLLVSVAAIGECKKNCEYNRVFIRCGENIDRVFSGPKARIYQVLQNIVNNSIKYGSEDSHIVLNAHIVYECGHMVKAEFSVEDCGPGIPETERERIFEPYYRGQHQTTNVEGSGLGLYICKRLVELMGGFIELTSSDRGTLVRLCIPLELESADI